MLAPLFRTCSRISRCSRHVDQLLTHFEEQEEEGGEHQRQTPPQRSPGLPEHGGLPRLTAGMNAGRGFPQVISVSNLCRLVFFLTLFASSAYTFFFGWQGSARCPDRRPHRSFWIATIQGVRLYLRLLAVWVGHKTRGQDSHRHQFRGEGSGGGSVGAGGRRTRVEATD